MSGGNISRSRYGAPGGEVRNHMVNRQKAYPRGDPKLKHWATSPMFRQVERGPRRPKAKAFGYQPWLTWKQGECGAGGGGGEELVQVAGEGGEGGAESGAAGEYAEAAEASAAGAEYGGGEPGLEFAGG